ncbi:MAG: Phosphoglycerate dehydrogenase [Firmicutes bacterium]|nr:Phosphoglycerate dehydrogenase [Bacillota bacterium]
MNCIFLDSIAPEMKALLLSQKPQEIALFFWDELNEVSQAEKLACADALLTTAYIVGDAFLARAPKLKIVQKVGVGTDNINTDAAGKRGIVVSNVPGGNANGVAELTIGLILDLYRKISVLDRETKAGEWSMWKYRACSYEMKGKIHGIIGFGHIGKRVAELSRVFGTSLLYYSRRKAADEVEKYYNVTYMELDELLQKSDIVSVHLPLNSTTRNLLNAKKLSLMQLNSVLINVGRGQVVKETDLYEALIQGKLAGAGIDVWSSEPINASNALLLLDNVVAMPHVGGGTVDAATNIFKISFEKILKQLSLGTLSASHSEIH